MHQQASVPHKTEACWCIIFELSTTVVKVDRKVTSASFSQNKSLQCVPTALTHVEIPRPHDATEQ